LKYHVVTTTNRAGWEETGRRMAESFLARWKMPLTVYAEGFEPDVDVEVRALPEWLDKFKAKYRSTPCYNGGFHGKYDFRYDMVKFAHKAAALSDFGKSVSDGVMIWLDADTFTHADVDEDWLQRLFPEPSYIAWLDRVNSFPETGFVMFRASHPYHRSFMESFENLYTTGDITRLAETHDAFALWFLAKSKMAKNKIPTPVSLSGASAGWHHPFVDGPLGARIDHMKGPRKVVGRSNVQHRDLRAPRAEAYWRNG
jgi:hypothetical protein